MKTKHKPYKVPCLYYSETSSGVNSAGDIYVDIESTIQTKLKALKEHKSLSMKAGVEHLGSVEHLMEREEATAKFRGMQVEIEYAEVFTRAINYRVMRAFSTLPFPDVPVHNE